MARSLLDNFDVAYLSMVTLVRADDSAIPGANRNEFSSCVRVKIGILKQVILQPAAPVLLQNALVHHYQDAS
jgi:hypothetical protein